MLLAARRRVMQSTGRSRRRDDSSHTRGGGGWGAGGADAGGLQQERRCNIERREMSTVTADEFHSGYLEQGRPLILMQTAPFASAAPRWAKDALLEVYGDLPVDIVRSSDIVTDQRWREQGLQRNVTMTLREYVHAAMGDGQEEEEEEPLYLFSSRSLKEHGIIADLQPPPMFSREVGWVKDTFEWDAAKQREKAIFYLGPANSVCMVPSAL